MKLCTVQVCDRPSAARELCAQHYARLLRHGDPGNEPIRDMARYEPAPEGMDAVYAQCRRWDAQYAAMVRPIPDPGEGR